MATHSVQTTANKLPFEIRHAISAFNNETQQAIVITLLNEGSLRFSELRDFLSDEDKQLHNQTLTNALDDLQEAGLVNKRVADADTDELISYYEVTEYGERFVDRLLETLGSVDSFDQRKSRYESVDNLHQGDGSTVTVEMPLGAGSQQSNEPPTAPGQER